MRKLTVAHIIYSWLPVTQNWIYTQLRCNTACDHHVISMKEECCGQFPWEQRSTAFPPESGMINKVRLIAARYWLHQPLPFMDKAIARINPDCIHGHFSTESWRILAIAEKRSLPLITTFYGLDVDKLPRKRFWKEKYPRIFSYGSRFMVEGPFMGEKLAALGCPEDKIEVVPLGVDRSLYRIDASADDNDGIRVLFVGLNREKKGPLDAAKIFVEATRGNKNLRMDVIGSGKYRKPFERIISEGGVRDLVTFHGGVSFNRYRELLAGCAVVLVPSCYATDGDCEGGAPVVCIEAQVAGKPIVGTKHCDIPNVTINGKTSLLSDEHAVSVMVQNILDLAQDQVLRERMGREGMKHTGLNHDIYRQTRKIAGIYRSVAHNAGETE